MTGSSPVGSRKKKKNKSLLQQCLSLGARHRIAVQIRAIRQRIQELNQVRNRYNLNHITNTVPDEMKGDFQVTRNFAALYTEEAQLVGFQWPKAELLNLVSSKIDGWKVVSIVGMGGLGKTTLAKKVYDSKELHERFPYCAWVTVSQSFNIMELLKDLIRQFLGPNSLENLLKKYPGVTLQVQHFTNHLREQLHGKRYFVVLDDLWTVEAWNSIKFAFPEHSSEDVCVVVTTRNIEIAKECSSPYSTLIYQLKALSEKDAKELLLRKINKPKGPDEDKLVDEILKKCGGLPLAIVTIGGLLANKGVNEWKSLRDQLPSELASSNPSLEALRQVVTLSYKHLPSHLKPCFLHLSIFPEDFEIRRKHLVNRWIAEGFIVAFVKSRSYVDALPRCIGDLQGLLTLDLGKCRVHVLPREITKLQNLRTLCCRSYGNLGLSSFDINDYIECLKSATCSATYSTCSCCPFVCECYCCDFDIPSTTGVRVPKGIGRLKDLQVLEEVDIRRSSVQAIKELGELTQLRKLAVNGRRAHKNRASIFSVSLQKLSSLRSLHVDADDSGTEAMSWLISISSPLPFLESLTLRGYLEKIPAWVGQSLNLVKVQLSFCRTKELEALAELPNLMRLNLFVDSCMAEKLAFRGHKFPKLKILHLDWLSNLTDLSFEESTSPHMEGIIIYSCFLTSGISGIKHLGNLKEISIEGGHLAKVDMLREEVAAHPKRPALQLKHVTILAQVTTEEDEITSEAMESHSVPG
ncbi:hypothetical protein ACP70R_047230 [Stipagrostis hirtigluma subsp. patula]